MNRLLGGKELKGHKRPGRKAPLVLFALLAGAVSLLATSVQAIFTLSLDNSSVAFGSLNVGQTTELPGSAGYHHTLRFFCLRGWLRG